jgi:hypothetical protein
MVEGSLLMPYPNTDFPFRHTRKQYACISALQAQCPTAGTTSVALGNQAFAAVPGSCKQQFWAPVKYLGKTCERMRQDNASFGLASSLRGRNVVVDEHRINENYHHQYCISWIA